MTNIAVQRIQREFREVVSDESSRSLFHIEANESDLLNLVGYVSGPPETPYEGGRFQLEIKVPETYPFNPPKVRFTTRIWHPNISSVTGAICLDILKDQWAAAMTMRTVLLSLQTLLALPEPSDPQDAVVARQYIDNLDLFTLTANYWTYIYALPNPTVPTHARFKMSPSLSKFPSATSSMPVAKFADFNSKIKRLVEYLGVDEHKAMHALSSHSWNLDKASLYLQ